MFIWSWQMPHQLILLFQWLFFPVSAAPSAPVNVNRTLLPANGSVGPRIEIRWDEPLEKNGVIQKYTLVHMYNKDKAKEKKREIRSKFKQRTYLHTIDVIAETTFSFKVNAYTIKEGPYQNGEDLVIPAYREISLFCFIILSYSLIIFL